MPQKIGIMVVHGMGTQKDIGDEDNFINQVETLKTEVTKRIKKLRKDSNRLVWKAAYWADILQPSEDDLWERLYKDNDMDYIDLRKFVISNLAMQLPISVKPIQIPIITL